MPRTPLYARIERILRARIAEAGPGALLPSEPALAAEFGVARMTARAAMNRLEAEGLVERVPGRGTFVRHRPQPRPAGTLMSFNDQVRGWGQLPSSRVLEAGLRQATADERDALGTEQVVAIVRVRMANGVPLAVEHARFGPGLADLLDVDLEGDSLHQALRARGLHPTLGSSTITAAAAGDDARWLGVGEHEPLLVETRLIVDQHAAPLEYTVSRYLGARYALQVAFDVRQQGEPS
jgi:GntR family transcriptional regulator